MSSSPLSGYTPLSPVCCPHTAKIDKITIHHAAGVGSAEISALEQTGIR